MKTKDCRMSEVLTRIRGAVVLTAVAVVVGFVPAISPAATTDQGPTNPQDFRHPSQVDRAKRPDRVPEHMVIAQSEVKPGPSGPPPSTAAAPTAESWSEWFNRAGREYQEIMKRISEPTAPNPITEAVRRLELQREQAVKDAAAKAASAPPPVARAEPPKAVTDGKVAPAMPTTEERRLAEIRRSDDTAPRSASKPGDPTVTESKGAAARREAEAKAAETAKAAEAKRAEDARKIAEVRKAADAAKAEAKRADDTRAEEITRKAAEEAKTVEAARRAEAAKLAEAQQKSAEAAKAEAARLSEASAARAVEEARKAADSAKLSEAKRLEEKKLRTEARLAELRRLAALRAAATAKRAEEKAARAAEAARKKEDADRLTHERNLAKQVAEEAARRKEAEIKTVETAQKAADAERTAAAQKAADDKKKADLAARADAGKASAATKPTAATGKVPSMERVPAPLAQAVPAPQPSARQPVQPAMPPGMSEADIRDAAASARQAIETARAKMTASMPRPDKVASVDRPIRSRRTRRGRHAQVSHQCATQGVDAALPGWYVVKPGDTLWAIAERHYHKPMRYRAIQRANRRVRNANLIYPCQRLYLGR
jgi:hypothetical protein